jgi:FMN reductase
MPILVISPSLKPASRSRVLAREAHRVARDFGEAGFLDLRDHPLPLADGATFNLPAVEALAAAIRGASAILLAAPVYNFDLNAAAKNLIEHTGKAWEDKVVGFLLAAGAQRSYMAAQSFAGSLALDFRSVVVPRFVYAVREDVSPERILSDDITHRVAELVRATDRLAKALVPAPAAATVAI